MYPYKDNCAQSAKVAAHLPTRSPAQLTVAGGEEQHNPFEGAITHRMMLSIEKCKEILKKYNYNLSNEEIKQVREVLYLFAEIQINAEKQLLEDEKCDIILQS